MNDPLTVTFDLNYQPVSWLGDWSPLLSSTYKETKDLRHSMPFLYSSEIVLGELNEGEDQGWRIENISFNNQHISVQVIKKSAELFMLTVSSDKVASLLLRIQKQNLIVDDPFHWTNSNQFKKNDDLIYLKDLLLSFSKSLELMDDAITKIKNNLNESNEDEVELLSQQMLFNKSLILATDNYVKIRSTDD